MSRDSFSKDSDTKDSESEGDDQEGLSRRTRLGLIADYWSAISASGETGATDWATLGQLEREVTEIMYSEMPDLDQAESLTAMALLFMTRNP